MMRRTGLTLLELLAVLTILAGLAALVIPRMGNLTVETVAGRKTARQVATESTMQSIRDAIMGTPTRAGVWADVAQQPDLFPKRVSDLFLTYQQIQSVPALSNDYPGLTPFNPITGTGWRGPYFVKTTGKDANGMPTLVDAWGNDILIQFPDEGPAGIDELDFRYVRLVSRGKNGVLETDFSRMPVVRGDDLLLFLRAVDEI